MRWGTPVSAGALGYKGRSRFAEMAKDEARGNPGKIRTLKIEGCGTRTGKGKKQIPRHKTRSSE